MSRVALPDSAFSLDRPRRGGRAKDDRHLKFVRSLPCLASGSEHQVEAAHIRYADPDYEKPGTPLARKPDDCWTVPLSADRHRTGKGAQHTMNERAFWQALGIDPLAVARRLYEVSGDRDAGLEVIRMARLQLAPWRR